jgi:O-glycosyl hydrolase
MIGIKQDGSASNLGSVAAVTPSGQKVVVLNNQDVSATYNVSVVSKQGSMLNLSLEPRSFTTIVYSD